MRPRGRSTRNESSQPMKKLPSRSSNQHRALKTVCRVSAAALMLGVSHAGTVGMHFQLNYCGAPAYSGFPVTMTAFGVTTNNWQNLLMMNTGYSSCIGAVGYTLNEVIDTTTTTNGLNPLPHGSLNVTWFGPTANFSGFAGYGLPPNYAYDGTPPVPIPTGEWQIYSSFLRDGVNFGPIDTNGTSSPGGDNNQPGYSVDITGLKSVFTNSPFVIELIAASDSMQKLTNAFVIDATAGTTNSVTYPSTPFPFNNEGGTAWFRGHGGGLSTASGTLSTDHVMIMGNRAAHGTAGGPNGFDNASTISGFIITDQPVVTMSPQPVFASGGDMVTLSAYAIGVPPLSYQWRRNGTPIPGETNLSHVIPSVGSGSAGNYDLVVTNAYGSTTSSAATVAVDSISETPGQAFVLDSKPAGVEHDGVNRGATWLASSTDGTTNRTGIMSFDQSVPDQITVPATPDFNGSTGTIMFWMRSAGTITTGTGGVGAMLFDRRAGTASPQAGDGLIAYQKDDGTVFVDVGADLNVIDSTGVVSDNKWHHLAIVYDQSASGGVALYIDGNLDTTNTTGTTWNWPATEQIELGLSHDPTWRPYNGLMDDVRIYNRGLTAAEIASVHTSNALVDTNALQLQLNFDSPPIPGFTLDWQNATAVLQSATSIAGPYTDLPSAASPYAVGAQPTQKFFRYHHPQQTLVSNPFLM